MDKSKAAFIKPVNSYKIFELAGSKVIIKEINHKKKLIISKFLPDILYHGALTIITLPNYLYIKFLLSCFFNNTS